MLCPQDMMLKYIPFTNCVKFVSGAYISQGMALPYYTLVQRGGESQLLWRCCRSHESPPCMVWEHMTVPRIRQHRSHDCASCILSLWAVFVCVSTWWWNRPIGSWTWDVSAQIAPAPYVIVLSQRNPYLETSEIVMMTWYTVSLLN